MTGAGTGVIVVWWITCLIWSSVWLWIKIGVRDVPPATFASARLIVALLVLLPVMMLRGIPLRRSRRDWLPIGASGLLLLGLNYALLYWGAQYVSSGLSAVLQTITPAFGLVFAHIWLDDERFTPWQGAGLLLGTIGVGIVFADQLFADQLFADQLFADRPGVTGRAAFWGCVAVTASAACVALGYVIVKRYGSHLRPIELTTSQMVCGLVPLIGIALANEGNPLAVRWTSSAIAALLYLAIAGSVVAFWLNYWLLKRMGATKVLAMSLVEPVIAVVLGAIVLHERLPSGTLLGGLAILLSTWMLLAPPTRA